MSLTIDELAEISGVPTKYVTLLAHMHNRNKPEEFSSRKEAYQEMFTELIGNKDMNQNLKNLDHLIRKEYELLEDGEKGPGWFIDLKDVASLITFSHVTRNLQAMPQNIDEMGKNVQNAFSQNTELKSKDKLTLKQFALLGEISKCHHFMQQNDNRGLFSGNKQLSTLWNQVNTAHAITTPINKEFNEKFNMPLGTIVFEDAKRKTEVKLKKLSNDVQLYNFVKEKFVTKYSHVAKGVTVDSKGENNKNQLSHINAVYTEEAFSLKNYLYTDVYHMDLSKLANSGTADLLKKNLGDDWQKQIEQKFAAIERQIHDVGKESKIHDHYNANIEPEHLREVLLSNLLHKNQTKKQDHSNEEVRDQVLGRGKWEKEGREKQSTIMCSEFIGRTLIAAVQELNDVITKDLQKKGVTDIPKDLFKSPFSEKENLRVMTPQRLLKAMEERGIVKQVETPTIVSRFIQGTSKSQDFKSRLGGIKTSEQEKRLEQEKNAEKESEIKFSNN